jgi:hypothetical protein
MKRTIIGLIIASTVSMNAIAGPPINIPSPYNRYNQQFTYNQNQQYGATNWYSSPLGMGVATAGVGLIYGLVNSMSQPSTPQVQQNPQVIYVRGNGQVQPNSAMPNPVYDPNQPTVSPQYKESGIQTGVNCRMTTVYDQQQNPLYVKVCE